MPVIRKKYLQHLKKFESSRVAIIRYSTSKLDSTQQVQFHYKLKGRGSNKGLLDKTHSLLVAKSVILVPENNLNHILKFLRKHSCSFKLKHLIINPSKLSELSKIAHSFKKRHSSILDVRLIEWKNKQQICIIAHSKSLAGISKQLESRTKIPVIHIQASQLLAPETELLETLRAGTSLLKKVPALPTTKKLFVYSTKHLSASEKVRFHYALKGRGDKEGIIAQTRSEFFAKSVIIASESKSEAVRRFLARYSCEFVELEVIEASNG